MSQALTDPADWHVPTLVEVFALIAHRPPRLMFLEAKLPRGEVAVARRMAEQYMEALRRYPELVGCAFVACPDAQMLDAMKVAFVAADHCARFDAFALDREELSNRFFGHEVDEADPLRGAGANRYLSIGASYKPLSDGDFDDLLEFVRRTRAATRRAGSPHHGKPLCVWTIDAESEMRALASLGPEFILTDQPARCCIAFLTSATASPASILAARR